MPVKKVSAEFTTIEMVQNFQRLNDKSFTELTARIALMERSRGELDNMLAAINAKLTELTAPAIAGSKIFNTMVDAQVLPSKKFLLRYRDARGETATKLIEARRYIMHPTIPEMVCFENVTGRPLFTLGRQFIESIETMEP